MKKIGEIHHINITEDKIMWLTKDTEKHLINSTASHDKEKDYKTLCTETFLLW